MKAIYKYPITYYSRFEMPQGAQILSVQVQQGKPVMWVLVDLDAPTSELRKFWTAQTGEPFDNLGQSYVGTYQLEDGTVWHLFELSSTAQEG